MPLRSEEIPKTHPRYVSLKIRHLLVEGFSRGLVAQAGLIAHGRGEAFDYLLGEAAAPEAAEAVKAGAAALLSSELGVISVNGNAAALVARDLVKLSKVTGSRLEVNLFYRGGEREKSIVKALKQQGAEEVLGVEAAHHIIISELQSARRIVDRRGIFAADTVFVPLEDGDRTEALRKMGKFVITVDLNPLSRTSRSANITIVDNIVRAMPLLVNEVGKLDGFSKAELKVIVKRFDNQLNLSRMLKRMIQRLTVLVEDEGFVRS